MFIRYDLKLQLFWCCFQNETSNRKKRHLEEDILSSSLVSMHANPWRIHTIVILFWIFDYSFWLFDYSFSLFDDRVNYSKFLLAVNTWFLLFKIIFVAPNKVLHITNNQMLILNIWIFWTNNGSSNQIFISVILIIRSELAFISSNILSSYVINHCASDDFAICWLIKFLFQEFFKVFLRCYISSSVVW